MSLNLEDLKTMKPHYILSTPIKVRVLKMDLYIYPSLINLRDTGGINPIGPGICNEKITCECELIFDDTKQLVKWYDKIRKICNAPIDITTNNGLTIRMNIPHLNIYKIEIDIKYLCLEPFGTIAAKVLFGNNN